MRIALGIEYDGSSFGGWQHQPAGNTVQDVLESAIARINGQAVPLLAAGRTDAGVHATGQVAHFDTEAKRPLTAWVRGVNTWLPSSIRIRWACPVDAGFHARFSAQERAYTYILSNEPTRPALLSGRVGWYHQPLDEARMREAAIRLLGRHDFSAFRAAGCQAATPVRDLRQLSIERRGKLIVFHLVADAFLYHMVRNIIGCLVAVGNGTKSPDWLATLRESGDRTLAAPTFAPDGLYLSRVGYDPAWGLPEPQGVPLPWLA